MAQGLYVGSLVAFIFYGLFFQRLLFCLFLVTLTLFFYFSLLAKALPFSRRTQVQWLDKIHLFLYLHIPLWFSLSTALLQYALVYLQDFHLQTDPAQLIFWQQKAEATLAHTAHTLESLMLQQQTLKNQ